MAVLARLPLLVARQAAAAVQSVLTVLGRPASYAYKPLAGQGLPLFADARGCVSPLRRLLSTRLGQALASIAALLLLLIIMAVATPTMTGVSAAEAAAQAAVSLARWNMGKERYIAAVLRNPVEGQFDPEPIRKKCRETKFQPGLVWHCETVNGGIGNVGNMWLNCLRYALEAGATSIILPRVGARSGDNLNDLGGGSNILPLTHLYDVDYFVEAWSQACPFLQPVLSESDEDAANSTYHVPANLPTVHQSPWLKPNDLGHLPRKKELVIDPRGWRAAFDTWLGQHLPEGQTAVSEDKPVRVIQRIALSHWNREAEPPDFADSFPRLFRFPAELRRLAAVALWRLEHQLGRPVVADEILFPGLAAKFGSGSSRAGAAAGAVAPDPDSAAATLSTHLGARRVDRASFLGVHLRVAEDAEKQGWPGYDAQAPAYLDEAARHRLNAIYVATGSAKHRSRFSDDAAARGLTVVTKEELLGRDRADAADAERLASLTWDQQAIVDFEVLVHSGHFAGFVRSSFSWVVAIRRSILPEAGVPAVARAKAKRLVEKYRDGLSVVVGSYDAMTIQGIWP